jgi:hypothetical protein
MVKRGKVMSKNHTYTEEQVLEAATWLREVAPKGTKIDVIWLGSPKGTDGLPNHRYSFLVVYKGEITILDKKLSIAGIAPYKQETTSFPAHIHQSDRYIDILSGIGFILWRDTQAYPIPANVRNSGIYTV